MGFEIIMGNDHYQVKLSDEPDWVFGLQSGDKIASVGTGPCLVVAFSVWSTPDREEAYKAIEVAKTQGMSVRVGLLPYDFPEEIEAWLPSQAERPGAVVSESTTAQGAVQVNISQKEQASPVWLAVQDGKPFEIRQGSLKDGEIAALLSIVEESAR
ncbi:MAG: hypothetical protein SH868_09405 [Bythopirellula sp.]|nr:hypothetical protein [Bythopirellula sp.]